MTFSEFTHPEDIEVSLHLFRSLMEGESDKYQIEKRYIRKDGGTVWGLVTVSAIRKSGDGKRYAIGMVEDTTARKHGEEKIHGLHQQIIRHLDHIQAIHDIDTVIASSMDLRLTLDEVLRHAIAQLSVDAASVLLLDPKSYTLAFTAGRGFFWRWYRKIPIAPGRGLCGTRSPRASGVLEVFQRSPRIADPDWLDFLTTLAEQTAIAIDSSTLFEELQRSNANLVAAYETTIEGWSRALDLRDKETEGHSKRMTDMTMQLGQIMGLSDNEMLNVRHGALLHDIGKMGVPDYILLKPSSLTEEEWEIMKRHPVYAYDLLYPIKQLHSRWILLTPTMKIGTSRVTHAD